MTIKERLKKYDITIKDIMKSKKTILDYLESTGIYDDKGNLSKNYR